MSRYVREKQKSGKRNPPRGGAVQVSDRPSTDWDRKMLERVKGQRPLAGVQTLKDRAEAKGYKLTMFKGNDGDWEYSIEGLQGQFVRYPSGGASSWDLMLLAAELAVDELPG